MPGQPPKPETTLDRSCVSGGTSYGAYGDSLSARAVAVPQGGGLRDGPGGHARVATRWRCSARHTVERATPNRSASSAVLCSPDSNKAPGGDGRVNFERRFTCGPCADI